MPKKKLELSEDQIHKAAENCSSFAKEYWLVMTPTQQEQLAALRRQKLSSAANRVGENERAAGIQGKMAALRGTRGQCIYQHDVRDLYFVIADDVLRIKAIKDLVEYERLRSSYDTSMVYEAYYRYDDVNTRLFWGWVEFPEVKRHWLKIVILVVVGLIARSIWPDTIRTMVDGGLSAFLIILIGNVVYCDLSLRRLASQYFVLWEFEKWKHGIDDERGLTPSPPPRYELFSDDEMSTGLRGPRLIGER